MKIYESWCDMKKLSFSQILSVSLMLFAIFFGAGNMIFPPAMGQLAGSNYLSALLGFIITDAGIAILGITAIVLVGSSMDDLGSLISKKFAICLSIGVYLLIGPLFALPRTGSVSFEISVLPYINPDQKMLWSLVFTAIFFSVTYYLSSNPNRIVDIVGKALTPVLLISIFIIFITTMLHPAGNGLIEMGSISQPVNGYDQIPLFKGMIEGYNALDGPAGLAFAIIVINAIRNFGVSDRKSIAKYTIICGIGSAFFLSIVYFMLTYIGANTMTPFENGGSLLHGVTKHLFGGAGGFILGIAVLLACLTTSIGLTTSFANYFKFILPPSWTYKKIAAVVCFFSFVIANIGLSQLIQISLPILIMIYPVTVVLIVLSFFRNQIKHRRMVYVMAMIFTFMISFVNGLDSAGVVLGSLTTFVQQLPFYDLSLGWVTFAILGIIVGLLPFWPMNKELDTIE